MRASRPASVEMWLDPSLLGTISELAGGPSRVAFDYAEGLDDPVIINVASLVRQSVLAGDRRDARLATLPTFLATHVLERYRSGSSAR